MLVQAICINRNAESIAAPSQSGKFWSSVLKEENFYIGTAIICLFIIDFGMSRLVQMLVSFSLLGLLGGHKILLAFLSRKKLTAPTVKKGKAKSSAKDEPSRLRHERRTISCLQMAGRVARMRVVSDRDGFIDFTGYPIAPEPNKTGGKIVFCIELNQGLYRYMTEHIIIVVMILYNVVSFLVGKFGVPWVN